MRGFKAGSSSAFSAREAQALERGFGFAREPRRVGLKARLEGRPIGLRKLRARAKERPHDLVAQPRDRAFPGRVEPVRERQRAVGLDARQGQGRERGRVGRQNLARKRLVGSERRIERRTRGGIERGEPHAREIIVDLGGERGEKRGGAFGLVAERQQRGVAALGLVAPGDERRRFGEEAIDQRLRHAGLARAVGLGAETLHDVGERALGRLVLGRGERDDAVAVERRAVIDVLDVERVLERDFRRARFAEPVQDRLGRGADLRAQIVRLVDRLERKRVAAAREHRRILEESGGPGDRVNHFRRADAAVLVGIDQIERARVELDAARRARERHPQFLVERADRGGIGPAVDAHLVDAAGAEEAPDMALLPLRLRHPRPPLSCSISG